MDIEKMSQTIKTLRKEKGFTQRELAEKLMISDKTVSKWECGLGCPDISILAELSVVLGFDINTLLKDQPVEDEIIGGNMKNLKYYICPKCHNFGTSIREVTMSCCGRVIDAMTAKKADEGTQLKVEVEDGELYITSEHHQSKADYIQFLVYAVGGSYEMVQLYPEWDIHIRLQRKGRGQLVWYSKSLGLMYQFV